MSQHAQETTAETEAQSIRVLGLKEQRGVVEGELFQGIPEIVIIVGADREQTGVNLGFHFLEPRQHRGFFRKLLVHDGVTHRRTVDILDSRNNETDVTRFKHISVGGLGIEDTNLVGVPGFLGGLDNDLVAFTQYTFGHPNQ